MSCVDFTAGSSSSELEQLKPSHVEQRFVELIERVVAIVRLFLLSVEVFETVVGLVSEIAAVLVNPAKS